jgi:hypothetical protein
MDHVIELRKEKKWKLQQKKENRTKRKETYKHGKNIKWD